MRRDPDLDRRRGQQHRHRHGHGHERRGQQVLPVVGAARHDPGGEREEQGHQLGQRVGGERQQQGTGSRSELRRDRRRRAADDVRLRGEREERRADHERDRERSGLLVYPARQSAPLLGQQGKGAAGHEARHARHRVKRQYERVPVQDVEVVGQAGTLGVARDHVRGGVRRRDLGHPVDREQQGDGDQRAERQPRPQRGQRIPVPPSQRQLRVVHALDEGEVVDAHPRGDRQPRAHPLTGP